MNLISSDPGLSSIDYVDAFVLRALNIIFKYAGIDRLLTSQGYIGLYILMNVVAFDLGAGSLYDENSLLD